MSYIGDIALGKTFDTKFTTVASTGAPTVLAGSPVVSAYVDNNTTQITAGITLSVDFDGVVGLNNIRVVATSGNGYAAGGNYQLVITTGTVGGTSVVGYVVAEFSIEARSSLRPTTADQTLDVSAGGEAGIDWANIGSPTTAQNLSGTNIDPDQVVASVTGAVGSVTAGVNVTQLGGVAQSLTDLKDFADDGYDPATNKVQGVVLTDTITTYTGDTPQTGDSFARIGATGSGLTTLATQASVNTIDDFLDTEIAAIITTLGTPAGASVSADIAAIEAQTDDIGAAGAGLTAIPWNANWDAEVQSEVDDALLARNLDKLVIVSGTADSGSTTTMVDAARTEADADYWKGRLLLFTSGNITGQCAIITDFVVATDTFTFAPPLTQAVATQNYVILPGISIWDDTLAEHLISGSTGAALNAAGSAGDPWNTALPGAYGAGTAGKIVGDNINATISSRASQASLDTLDDFVDTEVAAIKAKTDQLTFTTANKLDATIQAAGDFAQAAADKVWLTAARTLTAFGFSVTVGTNNDKTGYALSAAGIQAIWDALTSALTTVGSIGKLLVDNVNTTISSRSSHSAADVWSVATRVLTAGTNIVLAKGTGVTGFNDLSTAQVNVEVLDVLNVDTFAEPGQEAPPATTTLVKKLGWLYKMARNRKTQDATTLKIYADDATTVDAKATISDNGTTYDHQELVSGP